MKNIINQLSFLLNKFKQPTKLYSALFVVAAVGYIFLSSGIKANFLTGAIYDDALYVKQAVKFLQFEWLGEYDSLTLAKMPCFSIFLAFCMASRIPYFVLIAICHVIAVWFFMRQTKWMFKNRAIIGLLLGMVILFNPIFAAQVNIYRNQLASICFTIFMGIIIGMFNPEKKDSNRFIQTFDMILAFIATGALFYTRDETIYYWALLGMGIIFLLLVSKKMKNIGNNLILPGFALLGVLVFGLLISTMNHKVYGVFTTCERTSAPFTSALQTFQSIENPSQETLFLPKMNTNEKIQKVAEIIPEFQEVSQVMCTPDNHAFKSVSTYFDRDKMDLVNTDKDDIPYSHFEWFWMYSIQRAGHYTDAKETAAFYQLLTNKMKEALKEGKLTKNKNLFSIGPYTLEKEEIATIVKAIPMSYKILFKFPQPFIKRFTNFGSRPLKAKASIEQARSWSILLNTPFLASNDTMSIKDAQHSLKNRLWNLWVILFAYTLVPLMFISPLLSLIAIIITLKRREWIPTLLLLFLNAGYIIHFLLLTLIEVSVGYQLITMSYYLISYTTILIALFLSLNVILSPIFERKKTTMIPNKQI